MGITYDEILDVLDIKKFPSERTFYTLRVGLFETTDIYETQEYLSPDMVEVSFTIDHFRLRSNLNLF